MANIGTLAVSVVAKTDRFERGMKKSRSAWMGFVKGFISVAAVTAAIRSVSSAISEASNRIDELAKRGRALGITYQEMRRLSIIAQMSGIEVNSLSTAMRALSTQVLQANFGMLESVRLFKLLGIEVEDLKGMKLDDLMEKVAFSIDKIEDPATKAALAARLLGRSGMQIVSAADGLADAAFAAERVNDALSQDQVEALEKANDAWTEYGETVNTVWNQITAETASSSKTTADGLSILTRTLNNARVELRDQDGSFAGFMYRQTVDSALPLFGIINRSKDIVSALRVGFSAEMANQLGMQNIFADSFPSKMETNETLSNFAEQSGSDYATAFEEGLARRFEQADSFENALKDATRSALHASMDEVESRLNALSGEADRIRSSARPRMSAGVHEKTAGFDIRGLMIGGGLSSPEQKQLDELEDQSKVLHMIYRRLGNQVAMVGA